MKSLGFLALVCFVLPQALFAQEIISNNQQQQQTEAISLEESTIINMENERVYINDYLNVNSGETQEQAVELEPNGYEEDNSNYGLPTRISEFQLKQVENELLIYPNKDLRVSLDGGNTFFYNHAPFLLPENDSFLIETDNNLVFSVETDFTLSNSIIFVFNCEPLLSPGESCDNGDDRPRYMDLGFDLDLEPSEHNPQREENQQRKHDIVISKSADDSSPLVTSAQSSVPKVQFRVVDGAYETITSANTEDLLEAFINGEHVFYEGQYQLPLIDENHTILALVLHQVGDGIERHRIYKIARYDDYTRYIYRLKSALLHSWRPPSGSKPRLQYEQWEGDPEKLCNGVPCEEL